MGPCTAVCSNIFFLVFCLCDCWTVPSGNDSPSCSNWYEKCSVYLLVVFRSICTNVKCVCLMKDLSASLSPLQDGLDLPPPIGFDLEVPPATLPACKVHKSPLSNLFCFWMLLLWIHSMFGLLWTQASFFGSEELKSIILSFLQTYVLLRPQASVVMSFV